MLSTVVFFFGAVYLILGYVNYLTLHLSVYFFFPLLAYRLKDPINCSPEI